MCGVPPGAEVVPYSPEVTKPVIRGGNVTSAICNEENKENHYERLRKMKFTEKLKYSSDHKTPGAIYQWLKEPLRCCKHKHVSFSRVKKSYRTISTYLDPQSKLMPGKSFSLESAVE